MEDEDDIPTLELHADNHGGQNEVVDRLCDDHKFACKKIDDATKNLETLEKNVYGEGPEGKGGLYGELNRRVSYKTLSILLTVIMAVVTYFAYSTLDHRGRIASTEATVKVLCENTEKIVNNQEIIMKRIDTFNNRQLRVMQKLELDPKWGE